MPSRSQEWLQAWNPRQVRLEAGGDKTPSTLTWEGGRRSGKMPLLRDTVATTEVTEGGNAQLVVRNCQRSLLFRAADVGVSLDRWQDAINGAARRAPEQLEPVAEASWNRRTWSRETE